MGHGHCQICVGRFYCILISAFIECVENVVLLLAVTVFLQGLRVHKSNLENNVLHGVTNIFNIYSNICIYRLLLCLQTVNKVNRQLSLYF
jgi:hypothetical protein